MVDYPRHIPAPAPHSGGRTILRVLAVPALAAALLLSACSPTSGSSGGQGSHKAATATADTSKCLPEETPITEAPDALVTLWAPMHVNAIPSCADFNAQPPTPKIRNLTTGASRMSDADAHALVAAMMNNQKWDEWALTRPNESSMLDALYITGVGADDRRRAALGAILTEDSNTAYPVRADVVSLPAGTYKTFTGGDTGPAVGVVITFVGPANATAHFPDGHVETVEALKTGQTSSSLILGPVKNLVIGKTLFAFQQVRCSAAEVSQFCAIALES